MVGISASDVMAPRYEPATRTMLTPMTLHLDPDELNTCVACGLCLPHCPTFRATGEEARSPRGRIDAMRGVEWRGAPIDDDFVEIMSTCVQCRGCEPACPSGVPFGRLIEGTRQHLAETGAVTPWWQRLGFAVLPRHRLLLLGSTAVGGGPTPAPRSQARRSVTAARCDAGRRVATTGTDVWLFTGCVMDAWMRDTHRSTARRARRARRRRMPFPATGVDAAVRCTSTPVSTISRFGSPST